MKPAPGDLSARELECLADELRADAARPPGQRRLLGVTAPKWMLLAAEVLSDTARGIDPRPRIDWRVKAMPGMKAVEAIFDAAPECRGISETIHLAAERLGLTPRTVERHWAKHLAEQGGVTYIMPFKSTTPTPGSPRRRR